MKQEELLEIIQGDGNSIRMELSKYYRIKDDVERIVIEGVDFEEDILISSLSKKVSLSVKFDLCNFKGHFRLSGVVFNNKLIFSRCLFANGIDINGQFDEIFINNSVVPKNGIRFNGGKYDQIYIDSNDDISLIKVNQGVFNELIITGWKIKNILFGGYRVYINLLSLDLEEAKSNIAIHNVVANYLFVSGSYMEGTRVSISRSMFNSINLNSLTNEGKIEFNNIQIYGTKEIDFGNIDIHEIMRNINLKKSEIEFIHNESRRLTGLNMIGSQMLPLLLKHYPDKLIKILPNNFSDSTLELNNAEIGNMSFKNMELQNFSSVRVINTELTSLSTFNAPFPIHKIKGNNRSLYEIFNNLYSIAQKKNNKREQIEYYKASQTALFKHLMEEKWYRNIPSIFSLGVSKIYSDHGTKWHRSMLLTTPILAGIFFSLMILLTNYDIEISKEGLDKFKEISVYYLQFLNPTHKLSFMDNKIDSYIYSSNFFFVLFDFLGRIFVAIGIYETIRSFRKFVRK
ncbi:hypothetical protein POV27_19050 [Aureisphaera galaxeae]|uniref:hypothetical protein n=1 Tax=Aureisphaera galaxeae TaxID=1538023 RepID=UPI0023504770|nr:hypothetical protein [Aureisphaera galaxeae]MDC8006158.1 hypothetical protein [Aureisphaera galaxeae]